MNAKMKTLRTFDTVVSYVVDGLLIVGAVGLFFYFYAEFLRGLF